MQVILTKDFHPAGQKGQAIRVAKGYFTNFLFPNGLAVVATKKNVARAELVNKQIQEKAAQLRKEAEKLRETLKETTLHLKEKLTKSGSLYSKVSATEIVEALKSQAKVEVSVNNVMLKDSIKKTGTFEVDIKLEGGLVAKVKLVVEGITE
jgi:large subunit ribosomal protein L9